MPDGVWIIFVLIESDWNLKTRSRSSQNGIRLSINRIRVEFKVCHFDFNSVFALARINRIRLEFKDRKGTVTKAFRSSINRIRLEFKAANEQLIMDTNEY